MVDGLTEIWGHGREIEGREKRIKEMDKCKKK
jgi:hypothetical protein